MLQEIPNANAEGRIALSKGTLMLCGWWSAKQIKPTPGTLGDQAAEREMHWATCLKIPLLQALREKLSR